MAYSEKARELRRCKHIDADGTQCRGWAVWRSETGLCAPHLYRRHQYPAKAEYPHSHPLACSCSAYPYPHRPAGGRCRWPEPYPENEAEAEG
jgi:hypothetical protein